MFYPLSFRGSCAGRTQMGKSWCWPPIYKLKAGYYLTVKYLFPFWFVVVVVPVSLFGVVYSDIVWQDLTGYKRKLSRGLSQPYFLWKIGILPFLACVRRWCAFLSCADEWVTSMRSHGKLAAELGCERALFSLRKCGSLLLLLGFSDMAPCKSFLACSSLKDYLSWLLC